MENIGLNVIEDKVKLQNEVHGVVVAQVKYGESEIEKREESRSGVVPMLSGVTNLQRVMMFVSNIVSTNNSKPYKSNAHNSK